jgi:hypothetical protein
MNMEHTATMPEEHGKKTKSIEENKDSERSQEVDTKASTVAYRCV